MSAVDPKVCPYCGQPLVNRDAAERLRKSQVNQKRELEKRIATDAQALADMQLAKERARLEKEAAKAQDKRVKALEGMLKRVQDENTQLARRVEKLSASERGDSHEVDVFAQLMRAFPKDKIERRGKGADILQAVHYDAGRTTQRAGTIVYECKDTIRWENAFIKQIQKAGVAEKTPYLLLVTRAQPKGESTVCVRDGVIIVRPAYVRAVAEIVRRMVIETHRAGLTTDGRDEKTARLFAYLTGDDFRQTFDAIVGAFDNLKGLLSEEKRTHERTWTRRGHAYDELARKSAAVDEAIRSIIESSSTKRPKVLPLVGRAKAG